MEDNFTRSYYLHILTGNEYFVSGAFCPPYGLIEHADNYTNMAALIGYSEVNDTMLFDCEIGFKLKYGPDTPAVCNLQTRRWTPLQVCIRMYPLTIFFITFLYLPSIKDLFASMH